MNRVVRSVMIDIGGTLSAHYLRLLSEDMGLIIYAIQPHPELAGELRALEPYSHGRLHVYEAAMTDVDTLDQKVLPFYFTSDRVSSGLLKLAPPPNGSSLKQRWRYPPGRRPITQTGETVVSGKTVESFVREVWLNGNITFVNIAVPGYAQRVLDGITTQRTWNVIKEINVRVHTIDWDRFVGGQSRVDDVMQTLAVHGFECVSRMPSSFGQEVTLSFRNSNAEAIRWPFGTHGLASKVSKLA